MELIMKKKVLKLVVVMVSWDADCRYLRLCHG